MISSLSLLRHTDGGRWLMIFAALTNQPKTLQKRGKCSMVHSASLNFYWFNNSYESIANGEGGHSLPTQGLLRTQLTLYCLIDCSVLERHFLLLPLSLHVETGHQRIGEEPEERQICFKNFVALLILQPNNICIDH